MGTSTPARITLAAQLAPIPNAPQRVINRLAIDEMIEVAWPVLAHSERVEENALIESAMMLSQQHLLAISRRRVVNERVTDVLCLLPDNASVMLPVRRLRDGRARLVSLGPDERHALRDEEEGAVTDAGFEVAREAGTSPARERRWGVIGGILGGLYGLGSALIAVFVEGASWWSSGPLDAVGRIGCPDKTKDPRLPARVPLVFGGVGASRVPSSAFLGPLAGSR
jgi:hypothetical protein